MSDCCLRGFQWDVKPAGRETTLAGSSCYTTGPQSDVAILLLHDLYGWTFTNSRLLVDHYAQEVGATVYLPDLFGGEILPLNLLQDQTQWQRFDLPAFVERNAKSIRAPHIIEFAKTLRSHHRRTGVIGFCYGGWAAFQLGKESNLVDCISTAHPSFLEKSEIEAVAVPVQILAPEFDQMFTDDLKGFCHRTIPTRGVTYDYQYFPGLEHGFATRGDPTKPAERKGMERAKNSAVFWFRQWLLAEEIYDV